MLTAYVCANKYKIECRKVYIGRVIVSSLDEGSRTGMDCGLKFKQIRCINGRSSGLQGNGSVCVDTAWES